MGVPLMQVEGKILQGKDAIIEYFLKEGKGEVKGSGGEENMFARKDVSQ